MKFVIASDIHGSAFWCGKLLEAAEAEQVLEAEAAEVALPAAAVIPALPGGVPAVLLTAVLLALTIGIALLAALAVSAVGLPAVALSIGVLLLLTLAVLLRVHQHVVGLVQLVHFTGRVGVVGVQVGVALLGLSAVRLLDIRLGGVLVYAKHLVIITLCQLLTYLVIVCL